MTSLIAAAPLSSATEMAALRHAFYAQILKFKSTLSTPALPCSMNSAAAPAWMPLASTQHAPTHVTGNQQVRCMTS
jgi:hypothetical protein